MPVRSESGVACSAVAKTGATETVVALRLACAVEQIEQAWWDVDESSGCACTACTKPIAHTSAIASMQTILTKTRRFVDALRILL